MSRVASAKDASIMTYRRARQLYQVVDEENEVSLKANARYVLGDSLMRICTGLPRAEILKFNQKYPVVVVMPSAMQEKIRCDACPGKHLQKNRYCSGNRKQKRKFLPGKTLRLRDRYVATLHRKLLSLSFNCNAC